MALHFSWQSLPQVNISVEPGRVGGQLEPNNAQKVIPGFNSMQNALNGDLGFAVAWHDMACRRGPQGTTRTHATVKHGVEMGEKQDVHSPGHSERLPSTWTNDPISTLRRDILLAAERNGTAC